MLAARGVNPYRIQSLGRWKSPLVVHYAGEAMSTGIAGDMRVAALPPPDHASLATDELRRFLARLDQRLAALEAGDTGPDPDPATASDQPAAQHGEDGGIVYNTDTGAIHRTLVPASAPAEEQKTVCGWAFIGRPAYRCTAIPDTVHWKKVCPRCLYSERMSMKAADVSDLD